MGYHTTVSGEIRIEPPLAWGEFNDSPFNAVNLSNYDDALDVKLAIDEETVDTPDGPLTRRTAETLVPAWDDSFKAYNLLEHVQQAVDAFPGHTFTGRLECEGEDNTDMWRVVVRDGRAVKVTPRIIWPDDAEAATTDQAPAEIRYTADVVLLSGGQVLLIERGWPPHEGAWALPGGHVDVGETSLQAAARELAEETGIRLSPDALQQVGVYDDPDRDPRSRYVTVAYTATVPEPISPTAGDDARGARWWPLDALPPLAFDHSVILGDGRSVRLVPEAGTSSPKTI